MIETILAALIGFYMSTIGALFSSPTERQTATTTDSVPATTESTSPTPPPKKTVPAAYAQSSYARDTNLPVGSNTDQLVATVISGSNRAPLTVEFTGTVSSTGYSIEYGDGQKSGIINCRHLTCPPTPLSSLIKKVSHTYEKPGTYVAKLRRHYRSNEADCAGAQCNIVATATITVSNPAKVCLGYKDGNLRDFAHGETTTTIPGGYLEKGVFLCDDGAWKQMP